MDLNQVTLNTIDLDAAVTFYEALGLKRIVWSPPRYARFECPSGSSTLSLHHTDKVEAGGASIYFETDDLDAKVAKFESVGLTFDSGPEDNSWRWREAWLKDPDGRRICLYHAGLDRRFPPWRIDDEKSS